MTPIEQARRFMHPIAWKVNSANLAFTEFYEVRQRWVAAQPKPHTPAAERPSRASAFAVCAAFLSSASRSALRSSSVGPGSRVFSLLSNSLRRVALITKPLLPCYILHDQAPLYGRGSAYSPECVEGVFCELPLNVVLRSSHSPGPQPIGVVGSHGLAQGIIPTFAEYLEV